MCRILVGVGDTIEQRLVMIRDPRAAALDTADRLAQGVGCGERFAR